MVLPDSLGQIVPSSARFGALPARVVSHALILVVAFGIAATAYLKPNARLDGLSIERIANQPSDLARDYQTYEDGYPAIPSTTVDTEPRRRGVIEHIVQPGETITELADKYGLSVNAIVWANQLADANNISAGQTLQILPVSGVLYTIRRGESLADVAGRFNTTLAALAEFNEVPTTGELTPGIRVVVPGGRLEDIGRAVVASRASDSGARGNARRGIVDMPDGIDAIAPEPLKTMPVFDTASINPGEATVVSPPPEAAASVPVSQPHPETYVVSEGDTLKAIADRHSVTVASLILANDLGEQVEIIGVGDEFVVPPPNSLVHRVQEGETVLSIADRYNATTESVIEANELSEPFIISPGQTLVVPEGEIEIEMVVQPPPPPEGLSYTVEVGDSVVALARVYGVKTMAIIAANGLRDPFILTPGQQLFLPGAQVRPSTARAQSAPAPRPQPIPAPAAAAAAPEPVATSSTGGWAVVEVASRFLGYRYTWGGHSPQAGFDCSGFTWYVYRQLGLGISNHDLWGQLQAGPRVGRDNLEAGDLVFFVNTYKAGLSHVGIYIGGGRFIHAQSERTGVSVTRLNEPYWASRYYGASRPW